MVCLTSPEGRPKRNTVDDIYWWLAVEAKRVRHSIRRASVHVAEDVRSYLKRPCPYSAERIRHLHKDVERQRARFFETKVLTDWWLSEFAKLQSADPSANTIALIAQLRARRVPVQLLKELFPHLPIRIQTASDPSDIKMVRTRASKRKIKMGQKLAP
jgi:hypothetical protein